MRDPQADAAIAGAEFIVSCAWIEVGDDDRLGRDLHLAADALRYAMNPDDPRYREAGQIVARQHRAREARLST